MSCLFFFKSFTAWGLFEFGLGFVVFPPVLVPVSKPGLPQPHEAWHFLLHKYPVVLSKYQNHAV